MTNDLMRFSTVIRFDDPLVRDHQLHGARALPGVAYLDLIHRFLRSKGVDSQQIDLRQVIFKEPIVPTRDEEKKLTITLRKTGYGWQAEGRSQGLRAGVPAGPVAENFQAEVRLAPAGAPPRIDVPALKQGAVKVVDMDEIYVHSRRAGLVHDNFMKLLGQIYVGPDYVLAEAHLSPLARQYLGHFHLHPAYLDGALSVPGILLLRDVPLDYSQAKPYIPLFIDAFRAFQTTGPQCYIYIHERGVSVAPSQEITYADIRLYNPDGSPVAEYRRFGAKKVRSADTVRPIAALAAAVAPAAPDPATSAGVAPAVQETVAAAAVVAVAQAVQEPESAPAPAALEEELTARIAALLGKEPHEIDPNENFYALGLDSRQLLQLVEELEARLGHELYPTLLFEYNCVRSLADYLQREYGPALSAGAGGTASAQVTEAPEATAAGLPTVADLERDLRVAVAGLLGRPADEIGLDEDFYSLGLDSRQLLQLVEDLEARLGRELYPTLLFEYNTIARLAEYLQTELAVSQTAAAATASTPAQAPAPEPAASPAGAPAPATAAPPGAVPAPVPTTSPDTSPDASPAGQPDFYYIPTWVPAPLAPGEASATPSHHTVLLVYPESAVQLKRAFAEALSGSVVKEIRLGVETRPLHSGAWEAQSDDPQALYDCLESLGEVQAVYFLGIATDFAADNLEAVDWSQEQGVISLFRLIKGLRAAGHLQAVRELKIVTNNVHAVTAGDEVLPYSASLVGFAKSLAKEYPRIAISCVDLDGRDLADEAARAAAVAQVLAEPAHRKGEEVAFRQGRRYARALSRVHLAPAAAPPFRKEGVYLIVGGAGGIGLELSRHLAATVQARLVLIGRSELTADQRAKIAAIEAVGGQVRYIRADATSAESMQKAVAEAKAAFGAIHGVIHSAIVLQDGLVESMSEESLRAVLAPKVRGSCALFKAVADEALDFFLFFSSAQSFIGNLGQSNYAAACTFKDALAAYLRQHVAYPVQTINWGYWGSVGVVSSAEYRQRVAAGGVGSIEPEEGMSAVETVLQYGLEQVMAIKLEDRVLEAMGVGAGGSAAAHPDLMPALFLPVWQELTRPGGWPDVSDPLGRRAMAAFQELGRLALLDAMQAMGAFRQQGERYAVEELRQQLRIAPGYHRLFGALLDILAEAGFIRLQGEQVEVAPAVDDPEVRAELQRLEERKQRLVAEYPALGAHVELLWTCVAAYPQVLRGEKSYMAVMFPRGSTALVEPIYRGNKVTDAFNQQVAAAAARFVRERLARDPDARVTILEVGAGTGGTSRFVLEQLLPYAQQITYYYTDLALELTPHRDAAFRARYPFVEFRALDISKDPEAQGFAAESIDFLFASNVLHATRRVSESLRQAARLLRRNGLLVVNESTRRQDFTTLTFGLTDGWWLFEDPESRIPGCPLLAPDQWEQQLAACGFAPIARAGLPGLAEEEAAQHLFLGQRTALLPAERPVTPRHVFRHPGESPAASDPDEPYAGMVEVEAPKPRGFTILSSRLTIPSDDFTHYWKNLRTNGKGPKPETDLAKQYYRLARQVDGRAFHLLVEASPGEVLEVVTVGKGRPVLLINGFGLTAPQWSPQLAAWSDEYQVIVIHLPGHGFSVGSKDFSTPGIAATFMRVLDQLEVEGPVHVVGSSWGGMVAQALAKEYPERVASVTLVCSFMEFFPQGSGQALKERMLKDLANIPDDAAEDLVLSSEFLNTDARNYRLSSDGGFSTHDITPYVTTPTLVVWGTNDQVIERSEAERLCAAIPGATLLEIQGAGHVPNVSHPTEFNRKVREFFRQQEARCELFGQVFGGEGRRVASVTEVTQPHDAGLFDQVSDDAGTRVSRCVVHLATAEGRKDVRLVVKRLSPRREYSAKNTRALQPLVNGPLGRLLEEHRAVLGLGNNDARELAFYQSAQRELQDYAPFLYGTLHDAERDVHMLLMEELVPVHSGWTHNREQLVTVLRGMAEVHAAFLNRTHLLPPELQEGSLDAGSYVRARDLMAELIQYNRARHPDLLDGSTQAALLGFVSQVDAALQRMAAFPQTLTHNDFTPRNLCLRRVKGETRLALYDWELARCQNPQHDLVEFLAFSLPDDATKQEFDDLVQTYMNHLIEVSDVSIAADEFREVLKLNLLEFGTLRMNLHLLGRAEGHLDSVDRACRNLRRMLAFLGLADAAQES